MFPGYKFQTLSPKLVDYSASYDQSMVNKLVALAYLLRAWALKSYKSGSCPGSTIYQMAFDNFP